jgi:hypothetical protein
MERQVGSVVLGVSLLVAGQASADLIGGWSEFQSWQAAMTAMGARYHGFRTSDVLGLLPAGTPISADVFAAQGVMMESPEGFQAYNDGGGFTDVWTGPVGPHSYWDLKLTTPVHAAYFFAMGDGPISLYLGDQLVFQPYGPNPPGFNWLGLLLDTPFDRIRIQNDGAPLASLFHGLFTALPVPGPGTGAMFALAIAAGRRRRRLA